LCYVENTCYARFCPSLHGMILNEGVGQIKVKAGCTYIYINSKKLLIGAICQY